MSVEVFLSTLSLRRATWLRLRNIDYSPYFYPRSPCGERLLHAVDKLCLCIISIHALLAESDESDCSTYDTTGISIHALLAESDRVSLFAPRARDQFLSTLSLRRATQTKEANIMNCDISIHALLAESDTPKIMINGEASNFYPRSPCGERLRKPGFQPALRKFLSTLSLRRATGNFRIQQQSDCYFYPRSPCGERRSARR